MNKSLNANNQRINVYNIRDWFLSTMEVLAFALTTMFYMHFYILLHNTPIINVMVLVM